MGSELSILRLPDRLERIPDRSRGWPTSGPTSPLILLKAEPAPEQYGQRDQARSPYSPSYDCLEIEPVNPAPPRYAVNAYTAASRTSEQSFEKGTLLSAYI
jgi:hypothetical protein